MKKLVVFLSIASVMLAACKKETNPYSYQFSFELNGKTYNVDSVIASNRIVDDTSPIGYIIACRAINFTRGRLEGQTDSVNLINRDFITLSLTCVNYSLSPDSVIGNYKIPYTPFKGKGFSGVIRIYSNRNPGRIIYEFISDIQSICTISKLKNNWISGTIKGYVKNQNGTGDSVIVSNGQFNLPLSE